MYDKHTFNINGYSSPLKRRRWVGVRDPAADCDFRGSETFVLLYWLVVAVSEASYYTLPGFRFRSFTQNLGLFEYTFVHRLILTQQRFDLAWFPSALDYF